MSSPYYENLIKNVLNASNADSWELAVLEWEILECEEDETCSSICMCGKENLKYLFTIHNKYNGNSLFSIGSTCINKFGRIDLKNEIVVYGEMFKLLHSVKEGKYITLSSEYFSRKLLRYLYEQGAFDTAYNKYNGKKDYEFFVKMFNKRNKNEITTRQSEKIRAIIVASLKPFLLKKLKQN